MPSSHDAHPQALLCRYRDPRAAMQRHAACFDYLPCNIAARTRLAVHLRLMPCGFNKQARACLALSAGLQHASTPAAQVWSTAC